MNMDHCIICDRAIEAFDIRLNICGDVACEYTSRTSLSNDNFVYDFVNSKPSETSLILSIAKAAAAGEKLNPAPRYRDHGVSMDLKTLCEKMSVTAVVKAILAAKTDLDVFNSFGPAKYGFIKFVLKSNLMSIKSTNLFSCPDIQVFEVSYFNSDQESFNTVVKERGSTYLYHGSNQVRWYSIMMNGLRVYSNTSDMVNGASYGAGIYLSDLFTLSHQYAHDRSRKIVGVFEVAGDVGRHWKGPHVFVVSDPRVLKLKYLLCTTACFSDPERVIDHKFNTLLIAARQVKKTYMNSIKNKRLQKEMAHAMSGQMEPFGLSFDFEEDNFYVWNVSITGIDSDSVLYKDMCLLGVQAIKMEIRFEDQYPITPPFIRIIEPIFQFRTGNITLGGSICTELLTKQGWSPAYNIESTLIQIKATILETGKLDHSKVGQKYSLEESRSSFKRMLLSHGWS